MNGEMNGENKEKQSVKELTQTLLINTYKLALIKFKNLQETLKSMEEPLSMIMTSIECRKTCVSMLDRIGDMKIEGTMDDINTAKNMLNDHSNQHMTKIIADRLTSLYNEASTLSDMVDAVNKLYNKYPFTYDLSIAIEYDNINKTVDIETYVNTGVENTVNLNQSIYDFRQSIVEYKKDLYDKIECLEK